MRYSFHLTIREREIQVEDENVNICLSSSFCSLFSRDSYLKMCMKCVCLLFSTSSSLAIFASNYMRTQALSFVTKRRLPVFPSSLHDVVKREREQGKWLHQRQNSQFYRVWCTVCTHRFPGNAREVMKELPLSSSFCFDMIRS